MIRMSMVVALALAFIGIVGEQAEARGLPPPQGVLDYGTPPGNDDFDEATVVSTLPFDETTDTSAATGASDDPVCDGQCATVWYRYTPGEDNAIGVSMRGSDYDAIVLVYKGTRDALEWVSTIPNASYRLAVSAGTTYYFMIMSARFDLIGGRLRFAVTDGPPLSLTMVVEPVAFMNKRTGVVTMRGEVTCSKPSQVNAGISLRRLLAQRYLTLYGAVTLSCTARSPFELEVQTYTASRFGDYYPPGQYLATGYLDGFDTFLGEPADAGISDLPMLVRGGSSYSSFP